jgi:RNA polymerase sigma-70 factor (ECF subfamily)
MDSNPHADFLRHYQPLHEAFVRYCGSHAYGLVDTEDLVQDAILATMQRFHTVRDKKKLLPFMITVANNLMRGQYRKRKFNAPLSEKQFEKLKSRLPDPDAAADVHFLHLALGKLPAAEKEAVMLFGISGFSMREIAEIQHASEGAVRVRVHRARQKLRQALAAGGVVPEQAGKALFSILF